MKRCITLPTIVLALGISGCTDGNPTNKSEPKKTETVSAASTIEIAETGRAMTTDNSPVVTENSNSSSTNEVTTTPVITESTPVTTSVNEVPVNTNVSETPTVATACTPVETLGYGVKGDGVTDDTSALNKAFASEKNICLSKRYKINGTLNISGDGIVVEGDGVLFRDTRNSNEILKVSGKNITIKNLELDGKNQTPHGISLLEHSSNVTFRNLNMHDFYARSGDGATLVLDIAGDNCHNIKVVNSTFANLDGVTDGTTGNSQGAVRAIYVNTRNRGNQSSNITIENNHFKNIKTLEDGDAIHFQGNMTNSANPYPNFDGVSIRDNTFTNCIKRAIKVQAGRLVIENNTIQVKDKMFTPIELFGDYNTVRNNSIDVENAISGITVKGDHNTVDSNTIIISKENHYTRYNGGYIYGMINLGDNNSFINNDVTTWSHGYLEKKGTEPGLLANRVVENTTIHANTFKNSQLSFSHTRGLEFTNNQIIGRGKEQQYYGIYYTGSESLNFNGSEIIANNIIQNVTKGIVIKNTSTDVINLVKEANSFDVGQHQVSNY